MHLLPDDNFKTRLTEREQLLIAVQRLMEHGIPEDLIPIRLTRAFYVDMDELNAVLTLVTEAASQNISPQRDTVQAA